MLKKILMAIMFSVFVLSGCGSEDLETPVAISDDNILVETDVEEEATFELPENSLFVALYTTNTVAVVDIDTAEVVAEIPVGAKPIEVIRNSDGSKVYVANSGTGNVYTIDTVTGEVVQKMTVGTQPVSMILNDDETELYVIDYHLDSIRVVNTTIASLIGYINMNTQGYDDRYQPLDCCVDPFGGAVEVGRNPAVAVYCAEDDYLYVANLGTYDISTIDLCTYEEVLAYDGNLGAKDMFLDSTGDYLILCAAGSEIYINDTIKIIDKEGGEVLQEIQISDQPAAMTLSSDKTIAYVITSSDSALWKLDLLTGEVLGYCEVGDNPGDITISSDDSQVFTTSLNDGTITVVDTEDMVIDKTIDVGITPYSIVYIGN